MAENKFQLQDVIKNLSRTPKVLGVMLEGLSNDWIHNNEGENTWSVFEVVGHLIHGEKTDWVNRIQMILHYGDTKEFEPFDRQAHLIENQHKSLAVLLDEFVAIRRENLELVSKLVTENDLDRTGKHPDFGTVTLQELLATWTVHDFNHIHQISRVLAKYYEDEVGPWKAYLGVLQFRK